MPAIAIWLIAGLVYVLSVTGGYFAGRADGRKLERGIQNKARVEALQQQQLEFQGKLDAQAKIADDAKQEAEQAGIDRDAAGTAADRMRVARDAAVAAARKCSAVAGAGQTAYDPAGMLGRVLEESIDRNRSLAAYADSARIAAQACASSYEALIPKGKP